jgi:hypothetical protein
VWLRSIVNWWTFVVLLAFVAFFFAFLFRPRVASYPTTTLDGRFYYSPAAVDTVLAAFQKSGKLDTYFAQEWKIDLVFPVVYSALLTVGIALLSRDMKRRLGLVWLPVVAMLFDWIENTSILVMIERYRSARTIPAGLERLASAATSLKWIFAFASIFAMVGLALVRLYTFYFRRPTSRRVLPLTLAEVLNSELETISGKSHVLSDWTLASTDLIPDDFINNSANIDLPKELASVRRATAQTLISELNRLITSDLFSGQAFALPDDSWLILMSKQLRRAGKTTNDAEVRRVHRLLIEHIFAGLIPSAEDGHLREAIKNLHNLKPAAICLSGGGIRSATFALGILQGLTRRCAPSVSMMETIHYMSTVSGGGFIGSWLAAWLQRHSTTPGSPKTVFQQMRDPTASPLSSEPSPISWLRDLSNYLAPRFSMFSSDTWTLVAMWLRNVLINWLVYVPFLVSVLLVPRILVSAIQAHVESQGTIDFVFWCAVFLSVVAVFVAGRHRPSLWQLAPAYPPAWRVLVFSVVPTTAAALFFTLFWAWTGSHQVDMRQFIEVGVGVQIIGALIYLVAAIQYLETVGLDLTPKVILATIGASIVSGAAAGGLAKAVTSIPAISDPRWRPELYAILGPVGVLVIALGAGIVFTTVVSRWNRVEDDREYSARASSWLLLVTLAYAAVASISLYGPLALALSPKLISAVGGVTGLVALFVTWSKKTPAVGQDKVGRSATDWILVISAPVFVVVLLSAIAWGSTALEFATWRGEFPFAPSEMSTPHVQIGAIVDGRKLQVNVGAENRSSLSPSMRNHLEAVRNVPIGDVSLLFGASIVLMLLASLFTDVNIFSMHALYKNRLIRAYQGASNRNRKPYPVTGFDLSDSVALIQLNQKPLLIVNAALNLVKGQKLAWQQRKAATFTFSPLHCGNWKLGYRETPDYSGSGGPSLGTVVTISGAAVSPNMGYHTSPALSFLLAMFNIRLGQWLGNPGPAGGKKRWYEPSFVGEAWRRSSPLIGLLHQLAEPLGITDDQHQYVYLSDGGHFDNLGLYEMVLRRCKYIILSDAGADPQFTLDDLGNAVRKIRIDLGIDIEFASFALEPRDARHIGAHCAIGQINYSRIDGTGVAPGHLLYIKSSYYARGPADVRNYARSSHLFPHEPTTDQFFTESQFESYRRLGEWVIEQIVGATPVLTVQDVFDRASDYANKVKERPRW